MKIFLIVCMMFLVGCGARIEQEVDLSGYDKTCNKLYTVRTYVWAKWSSFIQESYYEYNIPESEIDHYKELQMKDAEKELAFLKECEAN